MYEAQALASSKIEIILRPTLFSAQYIGQALPCDFRITCRKNLAAFFTARG
jgi:hypothetical protein